MNKQIMTSCSIGIIKIIIIFKSRPCTYCTEPVAPMQTILDLSYIACAEERVWQTGAKCFVLNAPKYWCVHRPHGHGRISGEGGR